MSWIRERSPEAVRADALAMARTKLAAGCPPCASAFLDLARRNGATEAELQAVESVPVETPRPRAIG